jgi:rubrerythrin
MEATVPGMNRTGAAISPAGTQAMTDAADQLSPAMPIDTTAMEADRMVYINDAESVGSIPPPLSVKGVVKTGVAKLKGSNPSIFMDKLGERIAFERTGVRLYEALITKYQAVTQVEGSAALPPADQASGLGAEALATSTMVQGEEAGRTLERIRAEEHAHFRMLCEAMEKLGGDPTAMTPCADVSATASIGFMQVLTDPRTTLAQCLNVMLAVELTDNAGWELLIQLAEDAGEAELSGRFLAAKSQEEEHLLIVKAWLTSLTAQGAGTPAV